MKKIMIAENAILLHKGPSINIRHTNFMIFRLLPPLLFTAGHNCETPKHTYFIYFLQFYI